MQNGVTTIKVGRCGDFGERFWECHLSLANGHDHCATVHVDGYVGLDEGRPELLQRREEADRVTDDEYALTKRHVLGRSLEIQRRQVMGTRFGSGGSCRHPFNDRRILVKRAAELRKWRWGRVHVDRHSEPDRRLASRRRDGRR